MATILCIEDDHDNRRMFAEILQHAGHTVIEAATGIDGIRLANEMKPDLILVDIHIPDLDGYEVTLRLRSNPLLANTPIVAITADVDQNAVKAVGANGVIPKPINVKRFPKIIEEYLRERGVEDRDDNTTRLREQTQRIVARLEEKVVELSKSNARMQELARLRREFLQNVSHELATPMTPVVGYLRLLLNEELGPLTELQKKCLVSIEKSTSRLRGAVDTLLDVSTLETGRMHYFERDYDFLEVARQSLRKMKQRFSERDVTLIEALPEETWPAKGDPEKLQRAIVHVLDNAAKFTPTGGRVALQAKRGEDGSTMMISISDSGPGVKNEHIGRIIEPFFQGDGSQTRVHGGSGLGLAYAHRVTKALGGDLRIASPPDRVIAGESLKGTLVELWVRRAPKPEASSPP